MNMPQMQMDSQGANHPGTYEGEAGVDVLGFLQRHWGSYVGVSILVGLLSAGVAALALALPPAESVATMDISPTFPGAGEGKYPNRTPFSPQDIVAVSVVEPVWRAQGLERAISLADLCRNLQIAVGGNKLDMVRSEFQQKLSNAKLTAAERSALEDEYQAKLKALSTSAFSITLGSAGGALAPAQLTQVLTAIPAEWARSSEAAGVSAYDYPMPNGAELRASAASLTADGATAADGVRHAERLKDFMDTLAATTAAMAKVPGSDGIKDSRGASLVDLSQELSSTRRNLVIPAYLQMLGEAKLRDPREYAAIRSTRRKLLESDLELAKERARVLREAFKDYADETRIARRVADRSADETRQDAVLANVDGTFIDRVIEQAVKSRDVEYRRELTDRRLAAELEVVEKSGKLEFDTWIEETVQSQAADASASAAAMDRLRRMTDSLASYADRTREIMRILSDRNLSAASAMYRVDLDAVVRSTPAVSLRSIALGGFGLWSLLVVVVSVRAVITDRRGPAAG